MYIKFNPGMITSFEYKFYTDGDFNLTRVIIPEDKRVSRKRSVSHLLMPATRL